MAWNEQSLQSIADSPGTIGRRFTAPRHEGSETPVFAKDRTTDPYTTPFGITNFARAVCEKSSV